MKLAVYTLAGVMIAGMATGLVLSGSQPAATTAGEPSRREVYVDVEKLVQLHPAWEALTMTKSVVGDVREGSRLYGAATPTVGGSKRGSLDLAELDPSTRGRLVTETIRSADGALREMEAEQWHSVDTRVRMRRETMEKSAEAEVMVQVHEIEEQAAGDAEHVVEKHCPDRINAELKVSALKAESDSPGTDAKVTKSKLEAAEAGLNRIKDECAVETSRVWDDAKARIDGLLDAAATRTNASLSVYESGEKRKIGDRAASSRSEILGELRSLYEACNLAESELNSIAKARNYENSKLILSPISPFRSFAFSRSRFDPVTLSKWRDESADLESRIRQDVKCAVAKIARAEGVTVVFTRRSSRVPDRTAGFARLMSQREWHGCGPVISMASAL